LRGCCAADRGDGAKSAELVDQTGDPRGQFVRLDARHDPEHVAESGVRWETMNTRAQLRTTSAATIASAAITHTAPRVVHDRQRHEKDPQPEREPQTE